MSVIAIPRSLRDKLGDEATDAFIVVMNSIESEQRKDLATKDDINAIKLEIADVRSELKLLKWMTGILIAGVLSLVLKAFFAI